ncbi:MAG TPA: MFS transporter [Acidimicrobiia bacterium]|nr:MFS transporter [Acidimicrobiia bacterium]
MSMHIRTTEEATPRKAWLMLGLGVASQAVGVVFASTPAFLIPLLHSQRGMSLGNAGLLSSTPFVGMMLTLVAWGAVTDRFGEKWVISAGLFLTSIAGVGAMVAHSYVVLGVFFLFGGMAAASTSSASGRIVVGWFPKHRRGLAMGIRQMAHPLGVTAAAIIIPPLASHHGISAALVVSVVLNALLGLVCAIGLANPKSPPKTEMLATNPYKQSNFLWRIHIVSILLVVPQFTVSTFGLVWLISQLHWSPFVAGLIIGIAQFTGAIGRIGVGIISDKANSRVRPLRWVAISACGVMLLLALMGAIGWEIAAAAAFVFATVVTVADNGLAFTAVAEAAGPSWSGKSLGVQNTGQFIAASVVGPVVGLLISAVGYPLAFAITAVCPALAFPLVPKHDEEHLHPNNI